jgi:hypothetical protein
MAVMAGLKISIGRLALMVRRRAIDGNLPCCLGCINPVAYLGLPERPEFISLHELLGH